MFRAVILLVAIVYLTSTMAQFRAPTIPSGMEMKCLNFVCEKNKNICSTAPALASISDACTRQLDLGCIGLSMKLVSSYEQDDLDEVLTIVRSCQYVSGKTHETAMKNVYRYDRDELNEILFINNRLWLVENSCLSSAISKLKRNDFDSLEDLKAITNQCTGTFNVACFEKECSNRYRCDDQEEVVGALRKCISGPSKQDRRRL